jgi:adenylate cyclase class IV
MFEVEQKFLLSEKDLNKLVEDAEFLGEKKFVDQYFDTAEYNLTKNDIWLRKRGESFELKIPVAESFESSTNQYQEIEGEEKIREIFAIPKIKSFVEDIFDLGYSCFCECQTTRKKYQKGKFIIDLDEVEYADSDFKYCLAEVELLVENKDDIQKAEAEILEFAKSLNLEVSRVRGKVLEYLKREKPEHYQAIKDAGVLKE